MTDFAFVGYLVQEPYLENWPQRESMKVATIERDVHPDFKREWEEVDGLLNTTEFHIALPREQESGWVINGYYIERNGIDSVRWSKAPDGGESTRSFEYALHINRENDGLVVLGYELVDCNIERLSVLNNCGYTLEQIRKVAGELNNFALFSEPQQAQAFQAFVSKRGGSHSQTAIFEIWG